MHPGFKVLLQIIFIDFQNPHQYIFLLKFYNISFLKKYHKIIFDCFWVFVKYSWVFTPFFKILFFPFPPFSCPFTPCFNWPSVLLSFSVHGSRIAASQPKKHLLAPPVLIEKEDDAAGLGFLDYLGIFTLVAAIALACCCWIKCSSNTGTLGPL